MILYVVTKRQDGDDPVRVFTDPKDAKLEADAMNAEDPERDQAVYSVEV